MLAEPNWYIHFYQSLVAPDRLERGSFLPAASQLPPRCTPHMSLASSPLRFLTLSGSTA